MFPYLFFYLVASDCPWLLGEHISLNINMDDISQITRLKYHFIYFSKNNCDPHSGYLGRGSMFILNQRTLFHSNRKPAENWENSQAKASLSLFLLSYVLSSIKIQYSPEEWSKVTDWTQYRRKQHGKVEWGKFDKSSYGKQERAKKIERYSGMVVWVF